MFAKMAMTFLCMTGIAFYLRFLVFGEQASSERLLGTSETRLRRTHDS